MSERACRSGRPFARRILVVCSVIAAVVGVGLVAQPAWATFPGPDGRVVFGQGQFRGNQFRQPLFTMNPDGTAVRQLTDPPWGSVDTDEWWSHDGSTVVFERDTPNGPNGESEIYTIRADGTGLTQLTHCDLATDPYCSNGTPAWTPDGKTIVSSHCCAPVTGDVGIYKMRADGSHVRQITDNPTCWGDFGPTVSPNGRWVAFSRVIPATPGNCDQNVSAMFLVHLDGTGLHRITSYRLKVDEKDWSPDGSRIVFVSHAGSNSGPFRADLFSVAPDGSGLTQLTFTNPGKTFAFRPSWAPSGQRIMFDYYDQSTGGTHIYTMLPDGTGWQQVTRVPAGYGALSWGSAPLG